MWADLNLSKQCNGHHCVPPVELLFTGEAFMAPWAVGTFEDFAGSTGTWPGSGGHIHHWRLLDLDKLMSRLSDLDKLLLPQLPCSYWSSDVPLHLTMYVPLLLKLVNPHNHLSTLPTEGGKDGVDMMPGEELCEDSEKADLDTVA